MHERQLSDLIGGIVNSALDPIIGTTYRPPPDLNPFPEDETQPPSTRYPTTQTPTLRPPIPSPSSNLNTATLSNGNEIPATTSVTSASPGQSHPRTDSTGRGGDASSTSGSSTDVSKLSSEGTSSFPSAGVPPNNNQNNTDGSQNEDKKSGLPIWIIGFAVVIGVLLLGGGILLLRNIQQKKKQQYSIGIENPEKSSSIVDARIRRMMESRAHSQPPLPQSTGSNSPTAIRGAGSISSESTGRGRHSIAYTVHSQSPSLDRDQDNVSRRSHSYSYTPSAFHFAAQTRQNSPPGTLVPSLLLSSVAEGGSNDDGRSSRINSASRFSNGLQFTDYARMSNTSSGVLGNSTPTRWS